MIRRVLPLLVVAAALSFAAPGWAFDPATTGVVVIHGKWGRPGDLTIGPFAAAMRGAGFRVEQPEMPWSTARGYDRSFDAAMDEIQAAVDRLRAGGAKKIALVGHSLGGSGALRYAAVGRPLDALVLIAPAPLPEGMVYRKLLGSDVARAQQMVAAGQGADSAQFNDPNSDNRSRSLRFTAAIYLSYNGPDGPAAMTANIQHLGAAPVLWIAPRFDPLTEPLGRIFWPKLPTSTPGTRIEVAAHHMDAPMAGREAIVDWLRRLD